MATETLYIKNFLGITEAEITLNRLNLFIGPQARGKSVIVKLLYFFKSEFIDAFLGNIVNQQTKRDLLAKIADEFEAIFPKAYWGGQAFSIVYMHGLLEVEILGAGSAKAKLSVNYSEWLVKLQKDLRKHYQASLVKAEQEREAAEHSQLAERGSRYIDGFDAVISKVSSSDYGHLFTRQVFVPASRTFFANLQKNIFSFLANNIEIDPFLKEFGSVYERSKRIYDISLPGGLGKGEARKEIIALLENIVSGRYEQESEQDWIVGARGRINLANASSGQQEALPMLLVLSVMPFMPPLYGGDKAPSGFYIEEPEAHLFPNSQKLFVSLLALLSNATPHQFFITTHSPYLLTALNNCILAASAWQTADENKREAIEKLMPSRYHVRYEDVAAWTVTEQGTVQSILDPEAQLIGANLLDNVSQEFEGTTNALLDLMYED